MPSASLPRPKKMPAKRSQRRPELNPPAVDKFFAKVDSAPAAMTEADLDQVERGFNDVYDRRARRAGLLMLTMTGEQLIERTVKDRKFAETIAEIVGCVGAYAERMRAVVLALEDSQTRMVAALASRADMTKILTLVEKRTQRDVIPSTVIDSIQSAIT